MVTENAVIEDVPVRKPFKKYWRKYVLQVDKDSILKGVFDAGYSESTFYKDKNGSGKIPRERVDMYVRLFRKHGGHTNFWD